MDDHDLDPCQVLDWDRRFLDFASHDFEEAHLTARNLATLEWCDRERIRCLYFLAAW